MDLRKLMVTRVKLQRGVHRLNCAENDEIFAEVVKKLGVKVTKNNSNTMKKYP